MKITLELGPLWTFLLRSENGDSRLVQVDTDFPGVARSFGWSGRYEEDSSEAIWAAYDYLENHFGDSVEDPGYF